MGFSITLQAVRGGDLSTFARSIAWKQFESHAHPSPQGFDLWYDGAYCGSLDMDDHDLIGGISLDRPGDSALEDLYNVAKEVPSIIVWDDACAIADAAFLAETPDYLLNAFDNPPSVVHSGEELIQCIARS